jgi:hypothetical protein
MDMTLAEMDIFWEEEGKEGELEILIVNSIF